MVREVRTLWFHEKSFLDQPIITLPIVGDVPPRKIIYAVVFAVPVYLLSMVLGLDPTMCIISAIAGAMTGFLIAKEPKAVSIEKQLLYMLTGSYRPKLAAKPRHIAREVREEVAQVVLSEALEPVKIHGIVVDPYSGAPLTGTELALYVDGKPVARTVSDSQGRYTFYVHLRPGQHIVEVRLGDQVLLRKRVVVSVRRPARS